MRCFILLLAFTFIGATSYSQKDNSDKEKKEKDQDTKITPGASGVKRSIGYRFSTITSDSDPGNGIFRYNKKNISAVTYIIVDKNDIKGEDQTNWYQTWDKTTGATGRGRLTLVELEGDNVNVFDITDVFIDGKGYWKFPVEYVSGTLPVNDSVYYYVFERIAHGRGSDKEKPSSAEATEGREEPVAEVVPEAPAGEVIKAPPVAEPKPVPEPEPELKAKPAAPVAEPVTQPTPTPERKPLPEPEQGPPAQIALQPVEETQKEPVTQPVPEKKYDDFPVVQNYYQSSGGRSHGKWYRGIIEIGYALRVSEYGMNNFRFNFINGFNIKNTSVGLGIGVRKYYDKPANHPDWYLVSSDVQIPVFVDVRTHFSSKTFTPYLGIGIGGSQGFNSDTTNNKTEGLYFHATGGLWINLSERFAIFGGFAYELQKLEYADFSDEIPYKKNTNSISLNIGIAF